MGTLRPYIEQLVPSTFIQMHGKVWDAYDSATSRDVAIVKGSSISAVLLQPQQVLGKLDAMNQDDDFPQSPAPQPAAASQSVTVYNPHGAHSRVNVQSTDSSVNVSNLTETQVFSGIRGALTAGIPDERERAVVIEKLDHLEQALHTRTFLQKYQDFINSVASHITIIMPFIPALTQMLGR